MKLVFTGKNVAQWLMKSLEQIAIGISPKHFYSFREGDLAYTLQRCSNSFGLFLLLTEFKVCGFRRSIIIPVDRAKNGWRVFGLELRKLLELENYVHGGIGQSKFVAQLRKDNSGFQPFKSFADTLHGHQVQVRGRNQPKKQNPVLKQRILSKVLVSLLGPMTIGGRVRSSRCNTEEFNFGKTILVGNNRRSSLLFKSNGFEHGNSKYREQGNSDWARKRLTVEVNEEGKRSATWRKGGLWSSIWVSKGQREHVASGSRGYNFFEVGSAQEGTHVGHPVLPLPKAHRPIYDGKRSKPIPGWPESLKASRSSTGDIQSSSSNVGCSDL